jgi:SAM-dependent MidA family methyltransferase
MAVASAVRFDRFMAEALYAPDGFYSSGGSAGRRGDFLTAPEVGPLFGTVIARFLDAEWERLGRPHPFTVVDAGAGPGTLARAVLRSEPACSPALRYVAVEIAERQRLRHPQHVGGVAVESVAELAGEPFEGVVIANELLDNLPFRLVVHDAGWRDAFVTRESSGRYLEVLGPALHPRPAHLPETAALGARAPLHDAARDWITDATDQLTAGSLVAFDYISPTTASLAARPWREWLRTYRGHARGEHYLTEPGSQDITTEVALDQLPPPDTVSTQAQWLQLHGIAELVEAGKRYWDEHAALPDLRAMEMRSRIGEAEALLDPAGLGGFTVLEYRVG